MGLLRAIYERVVLFRFFAKLVSKSRFFPVIRVEGFPNKNEEVFLP